MDSFFGIGLPELFFIAVLALIFLGPERLPSTLRQIAKAWGYMRNLGRELTSQFSEEFKALEDLNPRKILNEMADEEMAKDLGIKQANKPAAKPAAKTTTPVAKTTTTKTAAKTTPAKSTTTAAKPGEGSASSGVKQSTTANAADKPGDPTRDRPDQPDQTADGEIQPATPVVDNPPAQQTAIEADKPGDDAPSTPTILPPKATETKPNGDAPSPPSGRDENSSLTSKEPVAGVATVRVNGATDTGEHNE